MRRARNADFGSLQETFLVCAVSTILIIRTDLWLTNYPQIGGHGLHIAHLLWGGLFMLVAIGTLVTFLGRSSRRTAAVVGGVGFGFFIDELGKFVTSDNNYFFKPAAAMIYVIFIVLFLVNRAMRRRRGLSETERLSYVAELVGEAARGGFTEADRTRALTLLDGISSELAVQLRRLVSELPAVKPRRPFVLVRAALAVRARLGQLSQRPWFGRAVAYVFAAWALLSAVAMVELVLELGLFPEGGEMSGFESDALSQLHLVNVASLAASGASAVLVAIGLRGVLGRTPLSGYRMLERALFISIFVSRLFAFVESQFAAVFGLLVDLLLLAALHAAAAPARAESAAAVAPRLAVSPAPA